MLLIVTQLVGDEGDGRGKAHTRPPPPGWVWCRGPLDGVFYKVFAT